MLCKHEVVGSIPSGSTRPRIPRFEPSRFPRCSRGLIVQIKVSLSSNRKRVIQHREEEMYSVDFGRSGMCRRSLGTCKHVLTRDERYQSVDELDRTSPDTFEANWSLSIEPFLRITRSEKSNDFSGSCVEAAPSGGHR